MTLLGLLMRHCKPPSSHAKVPLDRGNKKEGPPPLSRGGARRAEGFRRRGLAILICFLILLTGAGVQSAETYEIHIKKGDYAKALEVLKNRPQDTLTVPEKRTKVYLEAFEALSATTDVKLGQTDTPNLNRFYQEAKEAMLSHRTDIARDLLHHILSISPNHYKAKKLLALGLGAAPDSVKGIDIVKKYMTRANKSFYAGNYLQSKKALDILVILEKDNPLVYEKLGSTYYMMNSKKRAVEAWETALKLGPDNIDLKQLIRETKKGLKHH